ncbi:MAG: DUF2924 domain-containing protein [Spartobacteria bacterium]|nr:DUF2924 domain-containing protein [Spartobacteria bacterium]
MAGALGGGLGAQAACADRADDAREKPRLQNPRAQRKGPGRGAAGSAGQAGEGLQTQPRLFRGARRRPQARERLVRMHEGKKHSVLVLADGFEYGGQVYSSLTKITNDITGKRWNGWVFFGLRN